MGYGINIQVDIIVLVVFLFLNLLLGLWVFILLYVLYFLYVLSEFDIILKNQMKSYEFKVNVFLVVRINVIGEIMLYLFMYYFIWEKGNFYLLGNSFY